MLHDDSVQDPRPGKILIFEMRVPRTHCRTLVRLCSEIASFSNFLLQNLLVLGQRLLAPSPRSVVTSGRGRGLRFFPGRGRHITTLHGAEWMPSVLSIALCRQVHTAPLGCRYGFGYAESKQGIRKGDRVWQVRPPSQSPVKVSRCVYASQYHVFIRKQLSHHSSHVRLIR